jgi:16S rRNA (guanine527-N7)-methyltransferase
MREGAPADILRAGLEELGEADLRPAQIDLLLGYVELLQHWNRAYNLTSVREPVDMVRRHLLDSLSVLPWIPDGRLLDAGTGAGLPGVPLAIARPDVEVTLLDSAGKKIRFLNQVRRELGLRNIEPVQARLEEYAPEAPFDTIISRAFASLADFAAAARHLAKGSKLLAMKGRRPDAELEELPEWVEVSAVEKLEVPGLQEDRHLVIMSVIP